MICRPRAGTRPGGTHLSRIAIHRSPPDARGRRSFVFRALRTSVGDAVRSGEVGGRTAGDLRRSLERLRDPIVGLPRRGAVRMVPRGPGGGAIGNPTHRRARLFQVGGQPAPAGSRRLYSPGSRAASRRHGTGEPLGGPAIARSGRVVRPVRRPSDRQNPRRHAGGDPREICNQIPGEARDLSILGPTRGSR